MSTSVIAKTSADRARTLRRRASTISGEPMEPLRAAWRMRAAELQLVADVFAIDDAPDLHAQPMLVEAGSLRRAVA